MELRMVVDLYFYFYGAEEEDGGFVEGGDLLS